ncbi:type II toxin-antitoxin system ParD family antitoxin [Rhizobium tumorigenes]|uniref:Type II toxin-antitoxin system ParD family antitoxin n=1 Tax=Rhizobium tumorigenes TaxID=2041385 RepID=A0AAF1K9B2_9HYPH|nr:type II toxin-antitoxin system ParD family antitoxin [Rhizobium tumorigenes]WFR94997.1 type II toxin-antitoxin system ParD family antitoxin [Rhizobium tumorigenes]
MSKLKSVTLDEQMEDFVDEQVNDGHFASPSAVIDAGLRLLREQAEINAIRAAIIEGEQSGQAEPFDAEDFLSEMHRKHAR